ncbi:hypothetical protein SAMN04487926_10812 [Paraburkholderia steynii]|uniref:Uncharacterized protein n=1 Tax=Paraburkholderia steynii TaxID=1245441 RepID=A0A7Z7B5W4_9BURK|nr:hypothetical protein SAMN04487926_10812 [Paraburkholderia steynii]
MAQWLFSSVGRPVAFVSGEHVFSDSGEFLGRLYGDEVWHDTYKGEIQRDNRIFFGVSKAGGVRNAASVPVRPGIPAAPVRPHPVELPGGYRDI